MNNTKHVEARRGGHKKAILDAIEAKKRPAAADAEDPEATKADAAQMKAMKAMKVAGSGAPVMEAMKAVAAGEKKVKLQHRQQEHRKEWIVLCNGRYIAQCSEKQSAKYKTIMEQIKDEMEDGTLEPEREATRARSQALIVA